MALDRELLIKLLNMTASKHDGEVLSAIRKSNDLLRRSHMDWADLVRASEPPPAERPTAASWARSHATTGRMAEPDDAPKQAQKDRFKTIPLLVRIPLFPFRAVAELYDSNATSGRAKVVRGMAMLIAISLYLLCLGLSIAVLREAFRL